MRNHHTANDIIVATRRPGSGRSTLGRRIAGGTLAVVGITGLLGLGAPASADHNPLVPDGFVPGVPDGFVPVVPDELLDLPGTTAPEDDDSPVFVPTLPFDPSIVVEVPILVPIPGIEDLVPCTEDCGPDPEPDPEPTDPIDDIVVCTEDCGPDPEPTDPIDDIVVCTEDCGGTDPEDGEPEDGEPEDGEPEDGEPEDTDPEDGEPDDGEPEDTETDPAGPSIDEPVPGNPDFTG